MYKDFVPTLFLAIYVNLVKIVKPNSLDKASNPQPPGLKQAPPVRLGF